WVSSRRGAAPPKPPRYITVNCLSFGMRFNALSDELRRTSASCYRREGRQRRWVWSALSRTRPSALRAEKPQAQPAQATVPGVAWATHAAAPAPGVTCPGHYRPGVGQAEVLARGDAELGARCNVSSGPAAAVAARS